MLNVRVGEKPSNYIKISGLLELLQNSLCGKSEKLVLTQERVRPRQHWYHQVLECELWKVDGQVDFFFFFLMSGLQRLGFLAEELQNGTGFIAKSCWNGRHEIQRSIYSLSCSIPSSSVLRENTFAYKEQGRYANLMWFLKAIRQCHPTDEWELTWMFSLGIKEILEKKYFENDFKPGGFIAETGSLSLSSLCLWTIHQYISRVCGLNFH